MRYFLSVLLILLSGALACGTELADVLPLSASGDVVSLEAELVDDVTVVDENIAPSVTEPTSVSFSAASYDVGIVGRNTSIWAYVLPSEASVENWFIFLSAADEEIAIVSRDLVSGDRVRAIVTGISPGATSIDIMIASIDGVASYDASCRVYVRAVPVSSVLIDIHEKTFYVGATFKLTAAVKPDNATDKTVAWSSSSEDITNVNQSGVIKCLKAGKANIYAAAGGRFDMCVVTVKANPVWLDESDAVKVLPEGASFDERDGTLVLNSLNGAFEDNMTILRNADLYGYHIVGFYGYEESDEFVNGWRARIKDSSRVEVAFDRNEDEVKGELGIVILSNGAGYMPGADTEKHIMVKFSGKNETKKTTGCSLSYGFLSLILIGFIPKQRGITS
ncbi:MAG: Ig-like domain-containing protein [Synergistaceae bacterium]|nr:Ig-like domain-containing protein [Synergistaceae bacterium]